MFGHVNGGIKMYDNSLKKEIKWRFYNLGFKLFGNTKLWPKLSILLWN